MVLVARTEVIEWGSTPLFPWLAALEELPQLRALLQELLQLSTFDEQGRSFVTPQVICSALNITPVQCKVLVDLLAAVVEPADLVQRNEGGDEVLGVEVYSLALYLLVHFYLRDAHKADSSDVWPSEIYSLGQMEPSSPMRMTSHSWAREQQGGHAHKAYLPSMRQHLQQHLALQEALAVGFAAFLGRHADVLVALATSPSGSPGKAQPQGMISAQELDRLALLLRPPTPEEAAEGAEAQPAPSTSSGGGGGSTVGGSGRRKRRLPEGGSPMDVCPTPFTDGTRISEHTPFFPPDSPTTYAPIDAVVAWLADTLRPTDDGADLMVTNGGAASSSGGPGSPRAPSPQRQSVFNQLATQMGVLGPAASPSDIHGVHRATVARGEDDFPSARLRILDCHDAVVYALAPLQYALITACSDCVVVLGAVGRCLRVERCERVQVICASRCVVVNTCHDCIFYLGVNQAPLLLGDNRFLQLAPYNSGYERLPAHLSLAGVRPTPNQWDSPLALLPDHSKHHHPPLHGGEGASPGSPLRHWQREHPVGQQQQQQQQQQQGGEQGQQPQSPQMHQQVEEPMELSQQQQEEQRRQQQAAQQRQLQSLGSPLSPRTAGAQPGSPRSPMAGGQLGEEGLTASPVLGAPAAVTLLPPGKLQPFVVPFRGGSGPMCGGPAPINLGIRASSDSLSNFMAVGEGASGNFPTSPFSLPPAYVAAWQQKMQGAAQVRAAVKAAELEEGKKKELMAAIQAHFKEWLQATGAMRQVYDLARAERDEGASSLGASPTASGPS
ncbi:TBCC domain-containing 1 isoform A [Chlorella sorokiniana]|uniref:TBCC domain-containing protein 1 n=1 Tax=Chlorella sorokiniana TaxID=3076 RepID=A0A2P6TC19_CHLSO|nr:TBCC domain-containing 1 isoform A [Chlorella sorokiniana]|eukprot:PRW18405.1 TBCC domain-containing 1 isoform A [Chlorella sorokiniana]